MRAALIYQHNTQGADRKIADAMEALIEREVDEAQSMGHPDDDDRDDGAAGALVPAS
jgi:hypothetical protein